MRLARVLSLLPFDVMPKAFWRSLVEMRPSRSFMNCSSNSILRFSRSSTVAREATFTESGVIESTSQSGWFTNSQIKAAELVLHRSDSTLSAGNARSSASNLPGESLSGNLAFLVCRSLLVLDSPCSSSSVVSYTSCAGPRRWRKSHARFACKARRVKAQIPNTQRIKISAISRVVFPIRAF